MLREVHLSLVSWCNADCVFCPRSRFKAEQRFMPTTLVEKIIMELKSEEFKAKHDVVITHVGENGEMALHQRLIQILRMFKLASIPVDTFSNFSLLGTNRMGTIISEELLTGIHTNIDGFTDYSYHKMKGLDFTNVCNNILNFFDLRWRSPIQLYIHIMTAERYIGAVKKWSGKYPHRLPESTELIEHEAAEIMAAWRPYLRTNDSMGFDDCLMWAERPYTPYIKGDYKCPNIGRVESSAFIAPNGDWYICCFDMGNELVLGNLYHQTIDEIYNSDIRKRILELLYERKFKKLGPPCNRVDCCQVIVP